MTTQGAAAMAGAMVGLGTFALLCAILPPAPINLAAALARIDAAHTRSVRPTTAWNRIVVSAAEAGVRRGGLFVGVPVRDLALLDLPVHRFVTQRLALAGMGLAAPELAWVSGLLLGVRVPVALPAMVAVAAAVGLSLVPVLAVREAAAAAREELRVATSAYLDLVAQERAAGRGPAQALREAAEVSRGWAFTRIRQCLLRAARRGVSPWRALTELSEQVGVRELAELADIMASAADGAAVYTTLTRKAASLRSAALATAQAEANARSERLVLPVTLLTFGFTLLAVYPAVAAILRN